MTFSGFLVGAAALAASPAFVRFRAGRADRLDQDRIAPTVTHAWGANIAIVRSELESTLVDLLGPSLQRGAGTRLVVNISSVWLASYAGGGGGGKPSDGGASNDYLESIGDAL